MRHTRERCERWCAPSPKPPRAWGEGAALDAPLAAGAMPLEELEAWRDAELLHIVRRGPAPLARALAFCMATPEEMGFDYGGALARARAPVRVYAAQRDRMTPPAVARAVASDACAAAATAGTAEPRARASVCVREFERCSHQLSAAPDVAAEIARELAELLYEGRDERGGARGGRARWEAAEKPEGACGGGGGAAEVHPDATVTYLRLRDADAPGGDAADVENPLDKKAG